MLTFLIRLILVLAVLWLCFRLWRALRQRSQRKQPDGRVDMLVRCAHCGTYVPRSEACLLGQETYCSAAHRKAAVKGDAA
ncbi:MAG: PP0621 family protein [Chromatiales bacterium]